MIGRATAEWGSNVFGSGGGSRFSGNSAALSYLNAKLNVKRDTAITAIAKNVVFVRHLKSGGRISSS